MASQARRRGESPYSSVGLDRRCRSLSSDAGDPCSEAYLFLSEARDTDFRSSRSSLSSSRPRFRCSGPSAGGLRNGTRLLAASVWQLATCLRQSRGMLWPCRELSCSISRHTVTDAERCPPMAATGLRQVTACIGRLARCLS